MKINNLNEQEEKEFQELFERVENNDEEAIINFLSKYAKNRGY